MGDRTAIEWTDATWNPVTGCTQVSPGCDRCYAKRVTERFHGPGSFERVTLHPGRLEQPIRWKRPRRIFVNSMSDLFHDAIPDEYVARVFAVMALTPRHSFQVLTKRHGRMRSLLHDRAFVEGVAVEATDVFARLGTYDQHRVTTDGWTPTELAGPPERVGGAFELGPGTMWSPPAWPLPNVWLGVSVEDQRWANIRVPALLDTPAAVRFLSCEPLLGPVSLTAIPCAFELGVRSRVDWVIAGGESGPGARPMHPAWARELRDECADAGIPYLFKQWGEWQPRPFAPPELGREAGHTLVPYAGHTAPADATVYANTIVARRVGKHAAGRELDGRLHDGYPA